MVVPSYALFIWKSEALLTVQTIPITRKRQISIPLVVPFLSVLLLVAYILFHRPRFTPHPIYTYTDSPFRIDSSSILRPGNKNPIRRPEHLPKPLRPKESGMIVPNAVHYVYGLKPVKEGNEPDELPYYAYLAIRSALLNIRPEKIYL